MTLRNFKIASRLNLLFFFVLWSFGSSARGLKWNNDLIGNNKITKTKGLYPSTFNVALKAEIYANATCGEDGPEKYCKLSDSRKCEICDAKSPDPAKQHNIYNVLNSKAGKWWQSPTLAQGDRYEYIDITLDLKQIYQIENVIVKAAISPKPASWILMRSIDGEKFQVWQYYARSEEECWTRYSIPSTSKTASLGDDEVVCTTMHSQQKPVENGEILTRLMNRGPGASSHSLNVQEFSKARYIRLSLQGLQRNGNTIEDKQRSFYSIREIRVIGRCLCSGHASGCRYSSTHERYVCECEGNTCGENCDTCCPLYNQTPWKLRTSDKGFQCEKCNCHGHANSCRYDKNIASQYLSLDTFGQFKGGGINCEKCQNGYYRPNGVSPYASQPCKLCDHCSLRGSTGFCTPDDNYTGKVAGACDCKIGYSGYKCDQCAAGYRQYPECMRCPCDSRGILPSHDCEGECLCKMHVDGELCDRCKSGYFALSHDNHDGCLKCDCFGIASDCKAARLRYESISTIEGWRVTDIKTTRIISPTFDPESGCLIITSNELEFDTPFWLAPKLYSGNRLSSYGSTLSYRVSWSVMRGDTSGKPNIEPNIVLVGANGMTIACGKEQYTTQEANILIVLTEHNWYHVQSDMISQTIDYHGEPVTRAEFLRVLTDIKYLMIRAKYHSEQVDGSFHSAILPIGEHSYNDGIESLVEQCYCPEGYAGFSCENCAWGYAKIITNSSSYNNHHECIKCDCNNHAGTCDLFLGQCEVCEHHTIGIKCERCVSGFYGDPTRGSSSDCKPCACPLIESSNQFSPSCQLDDSSNDNYVCTQCLEGYTGDHCESCDIGYFGDPTKLGDKCKPCPCNGGTCDQKTGDCLECRGNTDGPKCDRCKESYYGDPIEQNCTACSCNSLGSRSNLCDTTSGQCLCKPFFTALDCSSCVSGYGNVTAGCQECDCGIGADTIPCDSFTGICICLPGVVGNKCDRCDKDHYGLSKNGCYECQCNVIGSYSTSCDINTGQCDCRENFIGSKCHQCEVGYWGITTKNSCIPCNCNAVGSLDLSCDDTGQCQCRPGVTGKQCDSCKPGYYGFTSNGCQVCERCDKLGHICDQDTGSCRCPKLSFGEHCDRCRPDSYGLIPGIGCKSCACESGSIKSQCDSNGQCRCRLGFLGLKCDQCAPGYYGYPRCKPCGCNRGGTINCINGNCSCDHTGQCPCKKHAIGKRCDECEPGTFGLDQNNPNGCTKCFCFGRSTSCSQANLSWSQQRLLQPRALRINGSSNFISITNYGFTVTISMSNRGLNVTNGLSIIPEDIGDITLPQSFSYNYPLYWKLPVNFLGDKINSYGGLLKFKTVTNDGKKKLSDYLNPLVQIQGNNKIILEYYQLPSVNDDYNEIRLHESLWQIRNKPEIPVSREVFMVALQNVQHIFLKASNYLEFEEVKLLEVSLEIAIKVPRYSLPIATGVEICECPVEYNNTSCQDPSLGYHRWFKNETIESINVIDLVGEARACQCNGKSEICNIETGDCVDCKYNTAGKYCDICTDGYYGNPDYGGCKPCECPNINKKSSISCIVGNNEQVICHCKLGYSGERCERCAYGFYGYPKSIDGTCKPCNCNLAGSASDECDEETGQCNCKLGSTGRDCSQCTNYRHVLINNSCKSCDDNCTGILLDDIEKMTIFLDTETVDIANGYIPLPWLKLSSFNESLTTTFDEIKILEKFEKLFKNIQWLNFKIFMQKFEGIFNNAVNTMSNSWDTKIKSELLKNNISTLLDDIKNLRNSLNIITIEIVEFGDKIKKVGLKKSLEESIEMLNELRSVNFDKKKKQCYDIIDKTTDLIEWLESKLILSESLEDTKINIMKLLMKYDDLKPHIKKTIENFMTYEIIYSQNNNSYNHIKNQNDNIDIVNADVRGMIDEGVKLYQDADEFIIDSSNDVANFQSIKSKLSYCSEKLYEKEGISYRLNNEYNEKYVIEANKHVIKLTDFVNRYVALFDQTRNDASNSLKASSAYKNIVDKIANARLSATIAKDTAIESYNKIYSNDYQSKSLLVNVTEISTKSLKHFEASNNLALSVNSLKNKWDDHTDAVVDLKNSLNMTGIKDNIINIKLRELKGVCEQQRNRLLNLKNDHQILIDSATSFDKLINDYEIGISSGLKSQLYDFKREGDSKISFASEKLTEAQSIIKKTDAKLISLAHAADKRQNEFKGWNETLAEKLNNLRIKISEARNTADGIRISLKSSEGKKCIRSYNSNVIESSTTTSIVMTLAITQHKTEGALFYLASSTSDDFIALEMIDNKIKFLWNVGGGTGIVIHPEILEVGDSQIDKNWYRITAIRTRNTGTLTVQKEILTTQKIITVANNTNADFGLFDVTNNDHIWLGGLPQFQRRPPELIASNGLPGCVHQVIFNDKPIGIWNYITTSPNKACGACVEGAEIPREDSTYSFNGKGYSVRNRVSSGPYNKYTFGVSLSFKTFDENALLFLALNPDNNQHVMIFLREGYVVLHIGYGGKISIEMSSKYKYNKGNWTKVDAFRQYQLKKNIEKCSLNINGEDDKKIGAPTPQPKKEDIPDLSQAMYYIGGVPPSFYKRKLSLPTTSSFLGCISNINVQEGYDPMAEKYYGVESGCTNKPINIVGFYGNSYLEHQSFTFKKITSIFSFSFRSTQQEAVLLLSTFENQNNQQEQNNNDHDINKNMYYSVAIVDGKIQIRINAGKGELILQSNDTFNDGEYHTITIIKERKEITLRINDNYQSSGKLSSSTAIKGPQFGGLYFGGLPASLNTTKMIGSIVPLYGAIRNTIFNDKILRFEEALTFDRAIIGRSGPNIGKNLSSSLSRSMSSQPEGCQKVPYYSLEPGALMFGDKSHSHTQLYLNFKKFWEKKYTIEFDFRTYYPNGLLFITPGIRRKQYLMSIIRDGQLVLLLKSKKKKEIIFKTLLNDGNWHHIIINYDERKMLMIVDSQEPRTIKVPKKIGLESMMYIGGMPESGTPFPDQVVAKLETLKGCIRGLKVNGNIYDMVGSTSRAVSVGQCFSDVESGAYFQGDAYAVYKKKYELGSIIDIQLEFRTSELSGILLSITSSDGLTLLTLEINNGKIIMFGGTNEENFLNVEQQFSSSYTICDNQWHKIHGVLNYEELTLKVDDLDKKYGLPVNLDDHFTTSTSPGSLYIGGLPNSLQSITSTTRDHFNGCIKNVIIDNERRDWTDMAELHNIHLSSCPIP
ncbi:hypothetical protein HCN44_000174 [Aphidius gifuensis]|uniref:Uncharacterized protein n=1 Tax=Aphidius gifuensis TaxID=684658 RepID=A0A834XSA1_APHGI|nr:hypothetical protein HCN44_000174 [Aphidius gifuensis]